MPLTLQEQSQILRHLDVPMSRHQEVINLCDRIQSEVSVEAIRGVLQELISLNESRNEAAEGLIQADVLRWSEDRTCRLKWRYKSLQHDLANFLGYPMPYIFPF